MRGCVSVTTTNGGQSFVTTETTSVFCTFLATDDDSPTCPGAVTVKAVALAVDPAVNSSTGYHDVYLYFTIVASSRTPFFYEFYVDSNGAIHQENIGTLQYPAALVGSGTNADTFTMIVG